MSEINYKVGDRVRIKSLDWYKKTLRIPSKLSWINKADGFFEGIRCGSRVFTDAMCKFCGKVMTIKEVGITFYLMEEDKIGYEFTDEMIECLVDEPQDKMVESPVDEPQDKMVSLEKVVKYLQSKLEYSPDIDGLQIYDTSIEGFVNDLRKIMEE